MDAWKLFENTVTEAAKDKLMKGMSKFQTATKNGHRSQEHIFTLKNIIAHKCETGKRSYTKYLRHMIVKIIATAWMRTPMGDIEESETGKCVRQGTHEGAIISAVNLSGGINEYFADK